MQPPAWCASWCPRFPPALPALQLLLQARIRFECCDAVSILCYFRTCVNVSSFLLALAVEAALLREALQGSFRLRVVSEIVLQSSVIGAQGDAPCFAACSWTACVRVRTSVRACAYVLYLVLLKDF